MVIPPHAGVLCALGCAIADLRYDLSRTVERRVADLSAADVRTVFTEQRTDGERHFRASETPLDEISVEHVAQMSYAGQIHTLRVPVQAGWDLDRMTEAFLAVYRAEYGNTLGEIPVMIVNLKTSVQGRRAAPAAAMPDPAPALPAIPLSTRPVYFGGWVDAAIYDRASLRPGHIFSGPAILEQADTTSVIEPGMRARVDAFGSVLVKMAASPRVVRADRQIWRGQLARLHPRDDGPLRAADVLLHRRDPGRHLRGRGLVRQ